MAERACAERLAVRAAAHDRTWVLRRLYSVRLHPRRDRLHWCSRYRCWSAWHALFCRGVLTPTPRRPRIGADRYNRDQNRQILGNRRSLRDSRNGLVVRLSSKPPSIFSRGIGVNRSSGLTHPRQATKRACRCRRFLSLVSAPAAFSSTFGVNTVHHEDHHSESS
jgi:hypothetical protein